MEEDWLEDLEQEQARALRPAQESWVQDLDSEEAEFDDLGIYGEFEQELENDMISSAEAGFIRGFEDSG